MTKLNVAQWETLKEQFVELIVDNMDYKSAKEKMQEGNRIKKVDVFNLRDYFKYKDAIQNDKDLKDVFPSDYPIKQLDLFRQTLEKEQERS